MTDLQRREFVQRVAGAALATGLNSLAGVAVAEGNNQAQTLSVPQRPKRFGDGRDAVCAQGSVLTARR